MRDAVPRRIAPRKAATTRVWPSRSLNLPVNQQPVFSVREGVVAGSKVKKKKKQQEESSGDDGFDVVLGLLVGVFGAGFGVE